MVKEKPTSAKHTMPSCYRVLFSVLFLMTMSVLFAWVLEWRCRLSNADETWEWAMGSPLVFWYSCVVIFFISCLIASLFWRTFFGAGVTFSLVCIISFVSAEKYKLRSLPLFPEDLLLVDATGEVAAFVDQWSIVRLIAGVVLILIGSGLLEHSVRKVLGRDTQGMPLWQRWSLVPRTTFTLLSATALALSTNFMTHLDNVDPKVEWLKTEFVAWEPSESYRTNGFLLGFIYNLGKVKVVEPTNYNSDTMANLKRKYTEIARAENAERKNLIDVADNIIIVLDETFYDPELLDKYYAHTGKDLLPNLHKIFKKYPSGYMYSPEYGGNTANVEFEVLTGLSNYWSQTIPYTSVVSKVKDFPSVVGFAVQDGYDTTAIHAYDGKLYKRNSVYANLGYEKFIDSYDMKYKEAENGVGYRKDSEVYHEALDILQDSSNSQFLELVTMQNHAAYYAPMYSEFDFKITPVEGSYDLYCNFQSLHKADQYLSEFIAELDKMEEKTVMLWFGDHAAGILDEYYKSDDKADRDMVHLTPYFIYANFEIESPYTEKEIAQQIKGTDFDIDTPGVDLPVTTPNCLTNALYNTLGVKKPALSYLLDKVCKVEPILATSYIGGGKLSSDSAIEEYRMVNYDLLNGKNYWMQK